MNMLNSLVLEGKVIEKCKVTEDSNGAQTGSMTVATERYYRNAKGNTETEISYFDVIVAGNLIPFAVKLEVGRGLRIVGRLKMLKYTEDGRLKSKVVVIAEHLEVKPDFKKGAENEGKNKD